MDIFIYIINVALYVGFLVYLYRKKSLRTNCALPLAGLFAISSICAVLYYETPLYWALTESGGKRSSLCALLFIFINFVIYITPLSKLNSTGYKLPYYKHIVYFTVFLGIVAILPTIEFASMLSQFSVTDMAEQYELNQTETVDFGKKMSFLGRSCNGILTWFSYITPVLLFYVIAVNAKKKIVFLAAVAFIEPILGPMMRGGRGQLFLLVMLLVFNYLLFYNYFSESSKKVISKIGFVSICLVALLLVSMTIARTATSDATSDINIVLSAIYRYIGEGFVNFAETGWYTDKFTDGLSIFNGTGYTWMSELGDYFQQRDWQRLTQYMGFRMYVYYTVFGDYYLDFGPIGGLLFNAVLSYSFYRIVSKKNAKLYILIIINLYARIGMNGIYCYYYMNYMDFLLFTFLVIYLLKIHENRFNKY